MAPWTRDHKDPVARPSQLDCHAHDGEDPFVNFRRFVDAQFDRLSAGFHALPDMVSDLRRRLDAHTDDTLRSLTPHDSRHTQPATTTPTEEAWSAVRALLAQSQKANQKVASSRITRLFSDDHPSSHLEAALFDEPAWLGVDWFERSHYSPTNVERHPTTHQHGSMWRAAFEDLLSAELDKELTSWPAWTNRTNSQDLYASWAQAPRDWMLGLSCRGVLPPQLPSLYRFHPRSRQNFLEAFLQNQPREVPRPVNRDLSRLAWAVAAFDKDEINEQYQRQAAPQLDPSPETEQDLYEAFLGKQTSHTGHTDSRQQSHQFRSAPVPALASRDLTRTDSSLQSQSSTLVSTTTSTERTTTPDGTTTTQTLVTRRFADGREESTETHATIHGPEPSGHAHTHVHTQAQSQAQAVSMPSSSHLQPSRRPEIDVKRGDEDGSSARQGHGERKPNGWFWT